MTGKRKITLKNASGQTIKVKGKVIKDGEQENLGRFECKEKHKFDINDEAGKDLITKQIHIKRRAKHLILSKAPDGKLMLCKRDKSGKPKVGADIDEDEPDDFVDEEDKAEEAAEAGKEGAKEGAPAAATAAPVSAPQ
jgi:hypothetical protein